MTVDRRNPRNAWLFAGLMILLEIALHVLVFMPLEGFMRTNNLALWGFFALNWTLFVLLMLWFLQFPRAPELLLQLGLSDRFSTSFNLYLLSGCALGAAATYSYEPEHFKHLDAWFRELHGMTPVGLFAPLVEEPILRGYLYPAFRRKYSVAFATGSILAIVIISHWTRITVSFHDFLFISALNAALCLIRERNSSTYPCLMVHLGYNGVLAFN